LEVWVRCLGFGRELGHFLLGVECKDAEVFACYGVVFIDVSSIFGKLEDLVPEGGVKVLEYHNKLGIWCIVWYESSLLGSDCC
jgi:hypothetical protein